jgi:hypothetical protein
MLTIEDGGLVVKDPSDKTLFTFNWDAHLATGVQIATSTFAIRAIRPSGDTALTKDSESAAGIAPLARTTQLRVIAGTVGGLYEIANTIVTNETPAQTKERSFRILVQNR